MTEEILYYNRTRNAEEKSRGGKFKFGITAVLLAYYYIIFFGTGGPRGRRGCRSCRRATVVFNNLNFSPPTGLFLGISAIWHFKTGTLFEPT